MFSQNLLILFNCTYGFIKQLNLPSFKGLFIKMFSSYLLKITSMSSKISPYRQYFIFVWTTFQLQSLTLCEFITILKLNSTAVPWSANKYLKYFLSRYLLEAYQVRFQSKAGKENYNSQIAKKLFGRIKNWIKKSWFILHE